MNSPFRHGNSGAQTSTAEGADLTSEEEYEEEEDFGGGVAIRVNPGESGQGISKNPEAGRSMGSEPGWTFILNRLILQQSNLRLTL